MAFDITKILKDNQLKNLNVETIKAINEACNADLNARVSEIEKSNSNKFESFVTGLVGEFDNRVNSVINESVKTNLIGTANEKMFTILKDVANLIESAGIPVTETTKLAQIKLKEADRNLVDAFKEREKLKNELDQTSKEKYIMTKLQGLKPEIVSLALEHFKNSDILDVEDEISAFIEGDFTDLMPDVDDDKFDGKELQMDQVKDALEEIAQGDANNNIMKEIKTKSRFESINKNLSVKRVMGAHQDNIDVLNESVVAFNSNLDQDAVDAMNRIQDFNNLGYKYR